MIHASSEHDINEPLCGAPQRGAVCSQSAFIGSEIRKKQRCGTCLAIIQRDGVIRQCKLCRVQFCAPRNCPPEGLDCPECGNSDEETASTVNHPAHYGGADNPYEVIKIIEAFPRIRDNFCLGNTVKYIFRAGVKDVSTEIEDMEKAVWYLQRAIAQKKAAPVVKPPPSPPAEFWGGCPNCHMGHFRVVAGGVFRCANCSRAYAVNADGRATAMLCLSALPNRDMSRCSMMEHICGDVAGHSSGEHMCRGCGHGWTT